MSARDRILGRLRGSAPAVAPSLPDAHALYAARRTDASRAERIASFCLQMTFWRGGVMRVTTDSWTARLRELCAAKGIGSLLYGAHGVHGAALAAAGIHSLTPYDRPVDEWKQELFENTDAGFTSACGAIAETGTLIVWPDVEEPRLISLVPPIHIALVDAGNIHDMLFAAMINDSWSGRLPTNALLISGPSKTADIQQTLAYGAHGPKELIVLLLVNEEEL